MFHQLPEPKCSKCGLQNSEEFRRKGETGTRCLSCGHEHVVKAFGDSGRENPSTAYVLDNIPTF